MFTFNDLKFRRANELEAAMARDSIALFHCSNGYDVQVEKTSEASRYRHPYSIRLIDQYGNEIKTDTFGIHCDASMTEAMVVDAIRQIQSIPRTEPFMAPRNGYDGRNRGLFDGLPKRKMRKLVEAWSKGKV